MKLEDLSKLVLAGSCVLLAAIGCGRTGNPVDTQGDPSSLHGDEQVQGARGDRNWDGDEDEDEDDVGGAQGAAGQAAAAAGAGGSAPVDKPGRRPGRFDPDADGGVDEDCEFGDGFRGRRWGHRGQGRGDKGGHVDPSDRGDAGPERSDTGPEADAAAEDDDDQQGRGRGGRR